MFWREDAAAIDKAGRYLYNIIMNKFVHISGDKSRNQICER